MDISHLLKVPKSGWFGHRETPGSSKIERYQPYYLYDNQYIGAIELLLLKIKDYCLGDFEFTVRVEQNGKTLMQILNEEEVFITATDESYEECLVALCKQTHPEMFK